MKEEVFIFDGDIKKALRIEFAKLAINITDTNILSLIDGFVNERYDIHKSFAVNKENFLKYVAQIIAM